MDLETVIFSQKPRDRKTNTACVPLYVYASSYSVDMHVSSRIPTEVRYLVKDQRGEEDLLFLPFCFRFCFLRQGFSG